MHTWLFLYASADDSVLPFYGIGLSCRHFFIYIILAGRQKGEKNGTALCRCFDDDQAFCKSNLWSCEFTHKMEPTKKDCFNRSVREMKIPGANDSVVMEPYKVTAIDGEKDPLPISIGAIEELLNVFQRKERW